ncbi:LysM peptidoglycan-binding domain-containing protein [Saccharopolyspora sp. 6T]|uniref:GH25 family lysozyme n=1 Tax=Saccharopolyspora sp. 6T TaxID=2877238 RepID=UPI001CD640C3|nr:GH25 family lysozyme [Saccharopolyspora sp. 6T]MCA1189158.1 LysM peptidoglycan-binding domain-containing protein [Saccharopolyspora sp. 6T]
MASIPGIDVARYQGEPDWAAVRGAGFAFTYIKATEGVGYVSPTLDSQLGGARGAGLVTGLYHFARPDTNSPQAEAADFAGQLARTGSAGPGNLPPCLDMETEAADLGAWIKGFVDALRGHTGRNEVVVYASSTWFSDKLATDSWVDPGVFLWVAHYGRPAGQPGFLTDRVAIHQHASDGKVPGIAGDTDLNVSLVDLPVLTGGTEAPPAPPPPPAPHPYVVQPGDTLSGIGAKVGVAWQSIAQANGITDPNLIYVGQVLRIPR